MAKRLDNFDFHRGRGEKYPWNQWLNGEIWQLTKGVDFEIDTEIMRRSARTKALNVGMNCRTHVGKNKEELIIQAFKPEKKKKPRT